MSPPTRTHTTANATAIIMMSAFISCIKTTVLDKPCKQHNISQHHHSHPADTPTQHSCRAVCPSICLSNGFEICLILAFRLEIIDHCLIVKNILFPIAAIITPAVLNRGFLNSTNCFVCLIILSPRATCVFFPEKCAHDAVAKVLPN